MRVSTLTGLVVSALSVAVFSYGVAVGRYEIFPYQHLKALQDRFQAKETGPDFIHTNFVKLLKNRYNINNPHELEGFGGGLTRLNEKLLGVDKIGQFYLYDDSGQIKLLKINLNTNIDEFLRVVSNLADGDGDKEFLIDTFRVYDVLAKVDKNKATLFVTHDHWNSNKQCVSLRISQLVIEDLTDMFADDFTVGAEKWTTFFQTRPCMPELKKIHGARSGGRMVLDQFNNLIVSVGDFGHDGTKLPNYPQNDNVSYGKIIGIDLHSLETRIISKGHRNPQGLHIDSDGNIWETEHGPTGGDELNIIRSGRNYGWPNVTYGDTHEGSIFGAERRRHQGYEPPIHSWIPSLGISNLLQVEHRPREWNKDLLVSSLKAGRLVRLRIHDGRVIFGESISVGDRIRDIEQMADGTIVLWTDTAELIELTDDEAEAIGSGGQKALVELDLSPEATTTIGRCQECHDLSASSSAANGPPLWNVYKRAIASTAYSDYSDALSSKKGYWEEASLRVYLTDPHEFARGSSMPNPYIKSTSTLDEVISYLKQLR